MEKEQFDKMFTLGERSGATKFLALLYEKRPNQEFEITYSRLKEIYDEFDKKLTN